MFHTAQVLTHEMSERVFAHTRTRKRDGIRCRPRFLRGTVLYDNPQAKKGPGRFQQAGCGLLLLGPAGLMTMNRQLSSYPRCFDAFWLLALVMTPLPSGLSITYRVCWLVQIFISSNIPSRALPKEPCRAFISISSLLNFMLSLPTLTFSLFLCSPATSSVVNQKKVQSPFFGLRLPSFFLTAIYYCIRANLNAYDLSHTNTQSMAS